MGVIFLNSHRGKSGLLNGKKLPEPYILACKFFDCGIIDRTQSLDTGFEQKVLDEIPDHRDNAGLSFAEICDTVAKNIVKEAKEMNTKIQVLWSGGIDSTLALIALSKELGDEAPSFLDITLSMDSINEYPLFFREFILKKLPFKLIQPPIANHFSEKSLIITGEHGDQLFGSDKLLPLIVNRLAYEDYRSILPLYLMNKFGKSHKVDTLMNYLHPLIESCPKPIISTFDLFWWLNFTIKWQQVTLRMPVFSFQENVASLHARFRHFFRDTRFQIWSLNNHENRAAENLEAYKLPAKQYIYQYTQDAEFLKQKSKEPSLKHILIDRKNQGDTRYRVMVKEDFKPIVEVFHKQFKNKKIV